MARPAKRSEDMVNQAQQMVKRAKTPQELRTGLSVLIPEYCGVSNAETAEALCVGVATVVRMQKQIGCGSFPITPKVRNINEILILMAWATGLFSKDIFDAGS